MPLLWGGVSGVCATDGADGTLKASSVIVTGSHLATLRKASFVRTTGLLKSFALASLVVTAASCGGSDDSSESRQRNVALSEPTTATHRLGISPDKVVLDDDGNAYVMSKQSSLIQKVTKDGVVSDWAALETNAVDLDMDENGNVYSLNNQFVAGGLEAKLTKFASDGSVDLSLGAPNRLDFIAVTSSKFAVGATEGMNTPVAFDLDTRVVMMSWDEFGDVGNDLIGGPTGVVALRYNLNDIMIRRFPAGMSRVETCPGMTDAKVASDGQVYVVCNQTNSIIVVDQRDEKTTLALGATSPYAIDVENGVMYVTDTPAQRVLTVESAGVSTELFTTGLQPVDIDVNSSGTIVVANRGESTVTFHTPVSTSGGTLEQMPALDAPEFGPVTPADDGFSAPIKNYDNNQAYVATSTDGMAAIESTGSVVVTGLSPDQVATVTVTVNRPGYSSAAAEVTGSSLKAALTYNFGEVTPTADGFTVPITNFDADWETKVGLNPSESQASLSDSGLLTVFGVGPDTEVTVDVYSIRRGYLTGMNSVTGRSAPAGQAPESSESEQLQGQPVEEITSSEIPQVDTSSTTTMAENPITTTEADSTTTTGAEQQGVTAATITSNNTTVAAVPPAAIENSVPVIVPAGTTEITCDDACVDTLLTYAGSTGGTVTASVAGAAPVPVEKGSPTALAVGDKDTSIAFTVTGDDGKETVVDVPVVQASDSVVTPEGESDSGSNSAWIWVILVLVLLLIVLLLKKRRQNDSASN